jgi:hypothetical protein
MVRSKYDGLTDFLGSRNEAELVTTFKELEGILGFTLPPSARTQRAWWANTNHAQGRSWRRIDWRTADLDLEGERVTFSKAKPYRTNSRSLKIEKIIADAKSRLSSSLGVAPEHIEISISL